MSFQVIVVNAGDRATVPLSFGGGARGSTFEPCGPEIPTSSECVETDAVLVDKSDRAEGYSMDSIDLIRSTQPRIGV